MDKSYLKEKYIRSVPRWKCDLPMNTVFSCRLTVPAQLQGITVNAYAVNNPDKG